MFYNSIITTKTAIITSAISFTFGFLINPYVTNSNTFQSLKSKITKNDMRRPINDITGKPSDNNIKNIIPDTRHDIQSSIKNAKENAKKDMKVVTERWFK